MEFAEFVTTLATGLTIINVYTTASVSAPSAGISGMSFRSQRRFGQRTITSSARLYMTIAVPYVAATVLVNRIDAEEVAPIYIAAVASISGRFNKGRHTVIEWIFKCLRTFTTMFVLALFMLFQGLSGEKRAVTGALFVLRMRPQHVLLSMITSFRWFVLLFLGFLTVPPEQKRTNMLLAVLKIGLVWLLIEGTGTQSLPNSWGVFDAVIVTNTPLRNTVFVLYSYLLFLDAAESVTTALVAEYRLNSSDFGADLHSVSSRSGDEDARFPTVDYLRQNNNGDNLLSWEDFYKLSGDQIQHYIITALSRLRKEPSDQHDDVESGDLDSANGDAGQVTFAENDSGILPPMAEIVSPPEPLLPLDAPPRDSNAPPEPPSATPATDGKDDGKSDDGPSKKVE